MSTITSSESTPTESTDNTRTQALLAAVGLLGAAALVSLAIPMGFSALYAALGQTETVLLNSLAGVVATLALAGIAVAYLRFRDVEIPIRRPSGREWGWIVGGVAISLVGAIVFAILEGLVSTEVAASSGTTIAAGASALTVLLAAAYFVVVVGPVEEYLYRGVVQGRLRQQFGPTIAIGVTSLGFALGHAPNFWLAGADLLSPVVGVALAGIVVGSVILGAIYERTANLAVVAITHGVFNAILFALAVVLMA